MPAPQPYFTPRPAPPGPYCPHGFPVAEHPPNCDTEWEDAGPPHRGLLCLGPTGDWVCRYELGHPDGHAPYIEGEYLRRRTTPTGDPS